ncbi:phage portal protein [Tetragenococcus halophilus]|uniref:phage portal protein n=1 Tax=Tetragenococcus halophilus TaxID=51669 RepID=UPI00209AAB2D|nr:phage portal protein [Tetragenococcus halophilus]MCO8291275.1 phage portal protein [Tetragenococcus halophilus]
MLTFEEARQLYESHLQNRKPRLKKLMDYYNGKHDILDKPDRQGKKDARVVHNYPRYISTITTGYTGNVNYSGLEENEALKDIFTYNNESSVDSDLLLYASIFGEAYELQWLNEDGKYCFEAIDPMAVMVITDGRLRETVTDAIIFDVDDTLGNEKRVRLYCYDDTHRKIYSYTENAPAYQDKDKDDDAAMASFEVEEEAPHLMGHCPIVQVKNNRWNIGDFEPVVSEVDAYNLSVSNSVNDLNDNTDAMMIFKNLDATTEEDVEEAKRMGGFKVSDNGDVKWLIKEVNDGYSEHIKDRLKNDIHKFSFVPDMSDEQFASNSSGVAIRYKLLALEQFRLEKIKWMRKAILTRLYMISDYLATKGQAFDPLSIGITFKANLPQNSVEIAEFVTKLSGITSQATQLTQLGEDIVPDVQDELEKIQEEKEQSMNDGFVPAPFVNPEEDEANGQPSEGSSASQEE